MAQISREKRNFEKINLRAEQKTSRSLGASAVGAVLLHPALRRSTMGTFGSLSRCAPSEFGTDHEAEPHTQKGRLNTPLVDDGLWKLPVHDLPRS